MLLSKNRNIIVGTAMCKVGNNKIRGCICKLERIKCGNYFSGGEFEKTFNISNINFTTVRDRNSCFRFF